MCFRSEKCVFPARNSTFVLFPVLCKRWGFFHWSAAAWIFPPCRRRRRRPSWNFRLLLLLVVVGVFLEFPPSSCCGCRRRPSWGFRLVPQARVTYLELFQCRVLGRNACKKTKISFFRNRRKGMFFFFVFFFFFLLLKRKDFFSFFEDHSGVLIWELKHWRIRKNYKEGMVVVVVIIPPCLSWEDKTGWRRWGRRMCADQQQFSRVIILLLQYLCTWMSMTLPHWMVISTGLALESTTLGLKLMELSMHLVPMITLQVECLKLNQDTVLGSHSAPLFLWVQQIWVPWSFEASLRNVLMSTVVTPTIWLPETATISQMTFASAWWGNPFLGGSIALPG